MLQSYLWISFLMFVLIVYLLNGEMAMLRKSQFKSQPENLAEDRLPISVGKSATRYCDLFKGKWVRDETNRPFYEEEECPFIEARLSCQAYGRPDKEYQYWRWKPHGCDLPVFNATMVLEYLRGKKIMYAGDSLNRGQFMSMVCLLHRFCPQNANSMLYNGSSIIFTVKEYNATVEFSWSPYLLESNVDDADMKKHPDRVEISGSISKHGNRWKGADIIVFNTYHWFITDQRLKIWRDFSGNEAKNSDEYSTEDAYRLAMKKMINWVTRNMDSKTARVFFVTMSPTHSMSEEWGAEAGGNCYDETKIISDPIYWGSDSRKSVMQVIAEELDGSSFPIIILNITQLSSFRKDAHTSIYKQMSYNLTQQQLDNPPSYADCIHWCLPGLQDTWNELLFAKLLYP